MSSSYTGLYVQRLEDGRIFNVQVVDTAGNGNAIEPDVYKQRGCKPPIEELPDLADYKPQPPSAGVSPLIEALYHWATGARQPTEQAIRAFEQAGWIARDNDGKFKLTPPGRQVLSDNGFHI
jgi:hypothetical protein